MAWKRSGVRFSLAPRITPGQRPGVPSFFRSRFSGGLRGGPRNLNRPVGHELFELVDGEPHAPTDPNRNQLFAPDELTERRSTQRQNLRGLDHVDEQRPGRGGSSETTCRGTMGWSAARLLAHLGPNGTQSDGDGKDCHRRVLSNP